MIKPPHPDLGSFTWVLRPKADPEPSPQMIFWVFLPMLILVLSSVINWSVVGLVKEYIAAIIGCCVCATWLALWVAEKCGRPEETKNEQEEVEMKGENKKETVVEIPEASAEGGDEVGGTKEVEGEKEKVQNPEEGKAEKEQEIIPKDKRLEEEMGESKEEKEKNQLESEEKKTRVEHEIKMMVDQESQNKAR